jgi:hypothetical protein
MQASIVKYGLLSPIVVSKANGRLVIIDGRKRLVAIKRLEFTGKLPRSLNKVPYIEVQDISATSVQTPALMSNRDLYSTVVDMFRRTQNVDHIASELFLTSKVVREILALARLSPLIRRAFFKKIVDFESAKTYAAFPSHALQNRAFMALGPFANEQDILGVFSKVGTTAPMRLAA